MVEGLRVIISLAVSIGISFHSWASHCSPQRFRFESLCDNKTLKLPCWVKRPPRQFMKPHLGGLRIGPPTSAMQYGGQVGERGMLRADADVMESNLMRYSGKS